MTDVTNPADDIDNYGVAYEEVADDQETEVNDQADEGDEPEEGSQDEEDDHEEYEEDGKTYKVHKDLKGHLLRNADYTKKTQEVAQIRKDYEARMTKAETTASEVEDAKFELKAIERRYADLSALTEQDWRELRQMDLRDGTNRYDALDREFRSIDRQKAEAQSKLDAKTREVLEAKQGILAKRQEEGHAVLTRDIPGWGPELGAKLAKFAADEFSMTPESHPELFESPEAIKLAYAAFKAKGDTRKAATQAKADNVTKFTPASTVKGNATPKKGLHDGLSDAEWFKREADEENRKRLQGRNRARP